MVGALQISNVDVFRGTAIHWFSNKHVPAMTAKTFYSNILIWKQAKKLYLQLNCPVVLFALSPPFIVLVKENQFEQPKKTTPSWISRSVEETYRRIEWDQKTDWQVKLHLFSPNLKPHYVIISYLENWCSNIQKYTRTEKTPESTVHLKFKQISWNASTRRKNIGDKVKWFKAFLG